MKLIVKFIALIIISFSCSPLWAAQSDNAPKQVPIVSESQLKAYALTQINWLSGGISGQSVSNNSWFSTAYSIADGDPINIAAALKKNKLTFSLDPNELVSTFAGWEVRTADGVTYTAFHGQRDFKLTKAADGSYQVPTAATNIELQFGQVPFPVKNVSNAYIAMRDSNGNQSGTFYFSDYGMVRDGYLLLTSSITGQTGDLYIQFQDGSKAIYTLTTGKQTSTVNASADGFDTTIKGVRVLADNAIEIKYAVTDDVVRVKYTAAATVVVRFDQGVALPQKVSIIEESVLKADPTAIGSQFDPSKVPVTFNATSGRVYLILFFKQAQAITVIGKG